MVELVIGQDDVMPDRAQEGTQQGPNAGFVVNYQDVRHDCSGDRWLHYAR
jgi:hypothetical protein